MMSWNDNNMGSDDWIAMTLVMVAFWSLVVFALAMVFRKNSTSQPLDPLRTLDERFARGEIDADDYHARRKILRADQ